MAIATATKRVQFHDGLQVPHLREATHKIVNVPAQNVKGILSTNPRYNKTAGSRSGRFSWIRTWLKKPFSLVKKSNAELYEDFNIKMRANGYEPISLETFNTMKERRKRSSTLKHIMHQWENGFRVSNSKVAFIRKIKAENPKLYKELYTRVALRYKFGKGKCAEQDSKRYAELREKHGAIDF